MQRIMKNVGGTSELRSSFHSVAALIDWEMRFKKRWHEEMHIFLLYF